MKKLLGPLIAAALLTLAAGSAQARFLEGYLAECTAITATSCTELTGGTYNRQPISFSDPARGVSVNRIPYSFGNISGSIAGRAVYDAPTGGNLLVTMPLATAISAPPDQGDVGVLRITVTGMVNVTNPVLYSAPIAAGATFGTTGDGANVVAVLASQIVKGEFLPRVAAADASSLTIVPVTGFTQVVPPGVSVLALNPAGTIAAGTVTTAAAPTDGQLLRILCSQTVTSLTVAPNTGQTLSASPTTCGATAGHELMYNLSLTKWFLLF